PDGGGFFAAQDADSEGREGAFYVWDPETLEAAVGKDMAPTAAARFGVTEGGNFEGGHTVLSVVASVPDLASRFGKSEEEIEETLREARRRMYEARSRRVWPGRDEKLLTDWSALAISGFALAGRVFSEPRYEAAARRAADRILSQCRRGGELLHRQKEAEAGKPRFAAHHANFVGAVLHLYEATLEPGHFRAALQPHGGLDPRLFHPAVGCCLAA